MTAEATDENDLSAGHVRENGSRRCRCSSTAVPDIEQLHHGVNRTRDTDNQRCRHQHEGPSRDVRELLEHCDECVSSGDKESTTLQMLLVRPMAS